MAELEKLEIPVESLQKHKLFIATPAYGGQVNLNFHQSTLALQKVLMECGIQHVFSGMGNESLITRGRNIMANHFLESEYTDLLFIDSDIEFNAADVLALLYFDRDLIGAAYPVKKVDFAQIKKTVLAHPDIAEEDLEKCGANWASHLFEGKTDVYNFSPVEASEIATGFMLISRKVFETLKPHVASYLAAPNEPAKSASLEDYFPVGVHNNRYESEDYAFCRLWREQGGKVWLCPWMCLNHAGTYTFKGDMNRVIQLTGEVH